MKTNGLPGPKYFKSYTKVALKTGDEMFVCFYCRGSLQQGTGRRFRNQVDGPVWEVHTRHSVQPGEIPEID